MRKGIGAAITVALMVIAAFIVVATVDSCNRHNKACFGISNNR